MFTRPRLFAMGGLFTLIVLGLLLALVGPVKISITLANGNEPVAAAPLADVPATATPAPPTALPPTATPEPTTMAPTATPEPEATATAAPTNAPATATSRPARPPAGDPEPEPTATTAPTATAPPATAVPGTPKVSIVKQSDVSSVRPGEQIVFVLVARNTGDATASDVVVSDMVPDALEVVDLSSTKGDVVVSGQTVTAYPSVLEPGEQVTVRISAKVRADAPAGELRNTAFTTTSTPGDDPGDNTSTITFTIAPPPQVTTQSVPKLAVPRPAAPRPAPQSLPTTADPDAPTFLLLWGPWLMLAMFVTGSGAMMRFGMFRTRLVQIDLALPAARAAASPVAPVMPAHTSTAGIDLDPAAVVQQWRSGVSVRKLAQHIAAQNPQADAMLVSLAVQRIIGDAKE